MSNYPPGFRNTCLLHLLLNPLTLGALLFGALHIGESIVNYFHAREAVTLLVIFFCSLVIGFFAALILFSILDACWLNSYVEREVKHEFRQRFYNTIIGCVLVLCTLITFFGYFGEEVGKTWDNMDIGIRNDEWASARNAEEEKPKKQSTEHEVSRATSTSSKGTHADTCSTSSTISSPHSAFSDQPSPSGLSYSDSKSIVSPTLFETHTEPAPQANAPHQSPPVAERITDYDCECAEGCEAKDFWITEEDDETHNSSCSRYGKGEGMYSAQGSGTDCTACGGAN